MAEYLSGWEVRQRAEERGYPTTHEQFLRFIRAGLVTTDAPTRWPESAVDQVVAIHEAAKATRSLPRRVLLLRRNYLLFPVSDQLIRRAVLEVLRTVSGPVRKMQRVDRAYEWWARRQLNVEAGTVKQGGGRLSGPDEWETWLRDVDVSRLAAQIHAVYYFLDAILPSVAKGTAHDLSDIPFEEQVALAIAREVAKMKGRT